MLIKKILKNISKVLIVSNMLAACAGNHNTNKKNFTSLATIGTALTSNTAIISYCALGLVSLIVGISYCKYKKNNGSTWICEKFDSINDKIKLQCDCFVNNDKDAVLNKNKNTNTKAMAIVIDDSKNASESGLRRATITSYNNHKRKYRRRSKKNMDPNYNIFDEYIINLRDHLNYWNNIISKKNVDSLIKLDALINYDLKKQLETFMLLKKNAYTFDDFINIINHYIEQHNNKTYNTSNSQENALLVSLKVDYQNLISLLNSMKIHMEQDTN